MQNLVYIETNGIPEKEKISLNTVRALCFNTFEGKLCFNGKITSIEDARINIQVTSPAWLKLKNGPEKIIPLEHVQAYLKGHLTSGILNDERHKTREYEAAIRAQARAFAQELTPKVENSPEKVFQNWAQMETVFCSTKRTIINHAQRVLSKSEYKRYFYKQYGNGARMEYRIPESVFNKVQKSIHPKIE